MHTATIVTTVSGPDLVAVIAKAGIIKEANDRLARDMAVPDAIVIMVHQTTTVG
jgi:hypothetical protein